MLTKLLIGLLVGARLVRKAEVETSTDEPEIFTTARRRKIVYDAYLALGQETRPSLRNVERPIAELVTMETTDTIAEVGVNALTNAGDPIQPTVGDLMGKLELNQTQMNAIFCYCHSGEAVAGSTIASRMKAHVQI